MLVGISNSGILTAAFVASQYFRLSSARERDHPRLHYNLEFEFTIVTVVGLHNVPSSTIIYTPFPLENSRFFDLSLAIGIKFLMKSFSG